MRLNHFTTALVTLNKTREVIISNKGLVNGIMSRIDKRGDVVLSKVYHTMDGRRHLTYQEAKAHIAK